MISVDTDFDEPAPGAPRVRGGEPLLPSAQAVTSGMKCTDPLDRVPDIGSGRDDDNIAAGGQTLYKWQ